MKMRAVLIAATLLVVSGATGPTTANAMVAPDLPESTLSVTATVEPSAVPSATPTLPPSATTTTEVAVTKPAVTPKPVVAPKPVPKPADPVTGSSRPSEPPREAWTAPPPTYVQPPAPTD